MTGAWGMRVDGTRGLWEEIKPFYMKGNGCFAKASCTTQAYCMQTLKNMWQGLAGWPAQFVHEIRTDAWKHGPIEGPSQVGAADWRFADAPQTGTKRRQDPRIAPKDYFSDISPRLGLASSVVHWG